MDLVYKCVSTNPCQHNFCAACYSDWMDQSSSCPECLAEVVYVEQNQKVRKYVDDFLEKNPDKKRSAEEYKDYDDRDQIKTSRKRVEFKLSKSYNLDTK